MLESSPAVKRNIPQQMQHDSIFQEEPGHSHPTSLLYRTSLHSIERLTDQELGSPSVENHVNLSRI